MQGEPGYVCRRGHPGSDPMQSAPPRTPGSVSAKIASLTVGAVTRGDE